MVHKQPTGTYVEAGKVYFSAAFNQLLQMKQDGKPLYTSSISSIGNIIEAKIEHVPTGTSALEATLDTSGPFVADIFVNEDMREDLISANTLHKIMAQKIANSYVDVHYISK